MANVKTKVLRLLTLAVNGDGEENRTAAMTAARLIMTHQLIRDEEQAEALREIVKALHRTFLALAWERRDEDANLSVSMVVDAGINAGLLQAQDRKQAIRSLRRSLQIERKKGVLISLRGKHGGFRMAANVVRSHG